MLGTRARDAKGPCPCLRELIVECEVKKMKKQYGRFQQEASKRVEP